MEADWIDMTESLFLDLMGLRTVLRRRSMNLGFSRSSSVSSSLHRCCLATTFAAAEAEGPLSSSSSLESVVSRSLSSSSSSLSSNLTTSSMGRGGAFPLLLAPSSPVATSLDDEEEDPAAATLEDASEEAETLLAAPGEILLGAEDFLLPDEPALPPRTKSPEPLPPGSGCSFSLLMISETLLLSVSRYRSSESSAAPASMMRHSKSLEEQLSAAAAGYLRALPPPTSPSVVVPSDFLAAAAAATALAELDLRGEILFPLLLPRSSVSSSPSSSLSVEWYLGAGGAGGAFPAREEWDSLGVPWQEVRRSR